MFSFTTRNAHFIPAAAIAALALATAAPADAAVIVKYEFTDASLAPTTVATGFVASDVTSLAANNGFTIAATGGNPDGHIRDKGENATNSDALAVSSGEYFAFTITPNAGWSFDPVDLTLDTRTGETWDPKIVFVRSSQDSFATNVDALSDQDNTVFVARSLSLSSLADVTAANPLTLRIYSRTSNNVRYLDFDNIAVNGVVVPEPASVGLAAVGLLGLLWRRQR